jgi:nitroreductase
VDVLDAIRRRRMTRTFRAEPVGDAELAQLVWAASRAPQAGNMTVRRFVVVTDPGVVRTIRAVMPSFVSNAPAAIVICTDLDRVAALMGERGRDLVSHIDVGTAAENICLAATALGLGVCFAQSSTGAALRAVLDLPPNVRPDMVVQVGWPAAATRPRIHIDPPPVDRDRYGNPWTEALSSTPAST